MHRLLHHLTSCLALQLLLQIPTVSSFVQVQRTNIVPINTLPSSFPKQSNSLSRHAPFPTIQTHRYSLKEEDDDDDDKEEEDKLKIIQPSPTLDIDGRITSFQRLVNSLPKIHKCGDELDKQFLSMFLPNMGNLLVVPLVNSVDTFWVGQMGVALALAGQAAANQAFFTLYFLIAFLPTITAPLVAKSIGSGNTAEARQRVCESIFLSTIFGLCGTIFLVGFPRAALRLVLPPNAPAMEYAIPYVRLRSLSLLAALVSATGYAAYRGLLNTVTPLRVSVFTNVLNLGLDPLCIFGLSSLPFQGIWRKIGLGALVSWGGFGAAGAAMATAISEITGGMIYIKLLLRRKLISWSQLFKPPSWSNLKPLVQGGLVMLARQAILNIAFLSAARRAQVMDPSGVSAAAYGIVMQIYTLGIVVHLAIQSTAAALVPSAKSLASGLSGGGVVDEEMEEKGNEAARNVADRTFSWGLFTGVLLGVGQIALIPKIVPLFSTLPEVQEAVKLPALISSFIHIVNGPLFAGEGILLGLERFKALTCITGIGTAIMLACLASPLGMRLDGILLSMAAFNASEAIMLVWHHVRMGPLRRRREDDVWKDVTVA
uniref:Polysaccharide biosynthesis protein C-terminal domain-containing protein n=1 Tax=Ditylum brightwellii TaxID=49249 RepID=A0A6U3S5P7_9STRA|mmetsp:Transcript_16521/g.24521  ORF Transcript_16521/g.24521 Transcript_16521/m.24521 type:complete len:599 (+) Transcript_16521:130-1926(+)